LKVVVGGCKYSWFFQKKPKEDTGKSIRDPGVYPGLIIPVMLLIPYKPLTPMHILPVPELNEHFIP
jgi:hypothetical protein